MRFEVSPRGRIEVDRGLIDHVYERARVPDLCGAHRPAGVGALQLASSSSETPRAEGLFERSAQEAASLLPLPHGNRDSPKGAACRTHSHLARRFPNLHLIVYPGTRAGGWRGGRFVRGVSNISTANTCGRDSAGGARPASIEISGHSRRKSCACDCGVYDSCCGGVGHKPISRSRPLWRMYEPPHRQRRRIVVAVAAGISGHLQELEPNLATECVFPACSSGIT